MYECFVKLSAAGREKIDKLYFEYPNWLKDRNNWGQLIFYKTSLDFEQAQFLAETLAAKLKKDGLVKIKVVKILEDWR